VHADADEIAALVARPIGGDAPARAVQVIDERRRAVPVGYATIWRRCSMAYAVRTRLHVPARTLVPEEPTMQVVPVRYDDLEREELLRVAHDSMLFGMVVNRAMLPQVVLHSGSLDALNDVAIDLWMGASPVYTHRMRKLMGIEGDDVAAIMKALQLDVGFVHQYMDVVYEVLDDRHADFRLNHCGALLDAEPHGEAHVFGMCHTIEDPTFDATAYATNPRARIRPVHRPPRVPPDRHPHCHWTITIDPDNEPVGPARLTEQVARLPLASVPNRRRGDDDGDDGGGGMSDYRGRFRPTFRLRDLTDATLAAVAREFDVQVNLLVCSGHLALLERFPDAATEIVVSAWVGSAWIQSERLARSIVAADLADRVARVLALHPGVPPGLARTVEVDGDRVRATLTEDTAGVLDPNHPGWPGLLAAGETRGVDAIVHAIDPTAHVEVALCGRELVVDVAVGAGDPVPEPPEVPLVRIGRVAGWEFDPAR